MRCPYCGGDVMIRGDRWECGHCGDSGFLRPSDDADVSFTVEFEVNLEETWEDMKKCLREAGAEDLSAVLHPMAQAVVYEITRALCLSERRLPGEKERNLRNFLAGSRELGSLPGTQEILTAGANGRVLFPEVGRLTEKYCGSFWQLVAENTRAENLSDIRMLFWNFGWVHQYFLSEGCDDEAGNRESQLEDAMEPYFTRERCLHPDGEMARKRFAEDDTSRFDDDVRDLLMLRFPEAMRNLPYEALREFEAEDFLKAILEKDRSMAEKMWNYLEGLVIPGGETAKYLGWANPFL